MKHEYIAGDLIIYTSLYKEPVAEICEVCETSYTIRFMHGNIAKVTSKEIKPIPLTPEILEKNGWKLHKRHKRNSYDDISWSSYHKPAETKISLILLQEEKAFFLFLYAEEISGTPIRYIHQLQHLLFGLGLNSEMEV